MHLYPAAERAGMIVAFCSLNPGIGRALPGAEFLLTGGGRRKQLLLANHFTYLPGECPWGSMQVGRAELLAPLRGRTSWFKVVLVNMPLSLHLWCQWVQKDPSLYPTKWQAGRMTRMQTGTPLSSLVSPEPCGELNTHPTWIC